MMVYEDHGTFGDGEHWTLMGLWRCRDVIRVVDNANVWNRHLVGTCHGMVSLCLRCLESPCPSCRLGCTGPYSMKRVKGSRICRECGEPIKPRPPWLAWFRCRC